MTSPHDIKQIVKERYGAMAREGRGCCPGSCQPDSVQGLATGYEQLDGYVPDADLGLGCGLPTAHAFIRPGDTVLDLGSGAGNDVFVARALTGDSGRVIGVDMTADMVARARANATRLGATNVEFRLGDIENLPLDDATVDVVLSNCVLNLVPDKARAFAEIRRVLKPGGRFSVSDIVLAGELPDKLREAAALYVGCIAGALQQEEYLSVVRAAGFLDSEVRQSRPIDLPDELLAEVLTPPECDAFRASGVRVLSVTVYGSV